MALIIDLYRIILHFIYKPSVYLYRVNLASDLIDRVVKSIRYSNVDNLEYLDTLKYLKIVI